jgi:hypothetical protein
MSSGTFLQKILKILSRLTVAFVLLLVFVVTSSSMVTCGLRYSIKLLWIEGIAVLTNH